MTVPAPAVPKPTAHPPVIEFDRVQRWFAERHVLKGLSFRVEPRQVYALLGRNAAGKTTALRIVLGLLEPLAGIARVFGVDSRRLGPAERARIGYVGEDHRLYPTMRVGGAVAFEAATRRTFRRAFAEQALQRCGVSPRQWIPRLSRGQRAQLSLVLAIAAEPELLICDDPALGLDVVMRRDFLDVMIDLLADTGCTVLFSSHFLNDVERVADRVGILHDGALLIDATLDDLKRRVRRAIWVSKPGVEPPSGSMVLRCAERRQGYELTLLDPEPALLARLAATGDLSPPLPPSLEELFLDLTGPERPGILREPLAALVGSAVGGAR